MPYFIQFLTGDVEDEQFAGDDKVFGGFLRHICTKNQNIILAVCLYG